jgi:hypothetical protein
MSNIHTRFQIVVFGALVLGAGGAGFAQTEHSAQANAPQTSSVAAVSAESDPTLPSSRLLRISSTLPGDLAGIAGGTVTLRFALYSSKEGGEALWSETQQIDVTRDGSYAVLLGSGTPGGLPAGIFAGGTARWLGVTLGQSDQAEQPRLLLVGVPYALEATDAQTLAGRAAADYVTREDLQSAVAGSVQTAAQASPETSPTGTGTTGAIPVWTGASTLGSSVITEKGTGIGIGTVSPATTLDVNGASTLRGAVSLAGTVATAAAAANSPALELDANSFLSTDNVPVAQSFALKAVASGNNTANPTANLELLFGKGAAVPVATGLSIAPTGQITFAPGQTFPGTGSGTITGVTASSPLTGSATSGTVTLGLNTAALKTTLNAFYAQLGAANTFTAPITFAAGQAFPGTVTSVTAAAPLTVSAAGGAVNLNLNTATLETTLNGVYPQLAAANTFAKPITFAKGQTFPGTGSGTITGVAAGIGLKGGGTAGAVTLNLDITKVPLLNAANAFIGNQTITGNAAVSGTLTAAGAQLGAGLSINNKGIVTFASGQAFPGTGSGTITGVTAGPGLTGGGKTGAITLNLDTTKVPLLSGANTFTASQTINGSETVSGTLAAAGGAFNGEVTATVKGGSGKGITYKPYHALIGEGTNGAGGLFAKSDTGIGAIGVSTTPAEGISGVEGLTGSTTSNTFLANLVNQVAGVWGDTNGNPNSGGYAAGVIGTADNADGGSFFNNSALFAAVYAENKGASDGLHGQSDAGGNGASVITVAPAEGSAGLLGSAGKLSSLTRLGKFGSHVAGVWGDTSGNPNSGGTAAGVIGTADTAEGGSFFNNSSINAAVLAENSGSYAAIRGISTGGGNGVDGVSTTNDGVKGNTTSGNGVTGISISGNGVKAVSTSGIGVNAVSASGNGVNGTSSGGFSFGVFGSGFNGVGGLTTSPNGTGVFGTGPQTGVFGEATTSGGFGVFGQATGSNGIGVLAQGGTGMQAGGTRYGVSASATGSGAVAGVYGDLGVPSKTGAQLSAVGVGIWADSDSANENEVALQATADNAAAAFLVNDSNSEPTVVAVNDGSGGGSSGLVIVARGRAGTCSMTTSGDTSCSGTLKSVNTAGDQAKIETYAVQSAENWVEDYGTGTLSHGVATVNIDPAFAETVNTGVDFHVFLTPGGDCKGLYVSNKTATSFEVHELGGGASSIAFDYKIVAKRRGFEGQRLVDVTEREHKMEQHLPKTSSDHLIESPAKRAPLKSIVPSPHLQVEP